MLRTDSMRKKRRRRSQKPYAKWRRRNERESFDKSRSERSEARDHRERPRHAGCARCGCGHARGAAFRFGEHKDQSRSRFVRRKTVAAKGDWSRPSRLQIVSDLARRRRRFWPEAARLFEESWKVRSSARFSKSAKRTHQRRGCFDHRQVCCLGAEDESVRRSSQKTD